MSDKFKSLLVAINEVLYNDWAPIGFIGALPQDEYESEAMRIISILSSGGSESDIAQYLITTGTALSGHALPVSAAIPVAHKLISFQEATHALKNL